MVLMLGSVVGHLCHGQFEYERTLFEGVLYSSHVQLPRSEYHLLS